MSQKIQIFDPHIHLWDLTTGLYPGLETPSTSFIGDNTEIARSYLLPEYLAEAGSSFEIVGAMHVEAFPTNAIQEVEHLQSVVNNADVPIGIIGNADFTSEDIAGQISKIAEYSSVRGIRQVLNQHKNSKFNYVDQNYMLDSNWNKNFKLLRQHNLSFDLQIYPHQMPLATKLAHSNPETPFILNHAGMWVDRTLDGWKNWRKEMKNLSTAPNVWVKISGLGMFDLNWTENSIKPLIYETLDIFGVDRVMFASNFPVDKLFSSYSELWSAFSNITNDLASSEKSCLFRTTAQEVYKKNIK